jgi:hypothetical protein
MSIDASGLTTADWFGCTGVIVWLSGVGLLAHAIPVVLKAEDDPFIDTAMELFPERVALVMSLVIVSWPLSVPSLAAMRVSRKRH